MEEGLKFDLSAASWRASHTDEHAFIQALAVRLEQALPGCTQVERSSGWFAKKDTVRRIEVSFDQWSFRIVFDRGGIQCERAKRVRGIVLKTEHVTFSEWLTALSDELETYAAYHEDARDTMHHFLMS